MSTGVLERADGEKPFMGMQTTRPGGVVRKPDPGIAKNYLTEPELQVLNRIVLRATGIYQATADRRRG